MSKGESTKKRIIEQAAPVFNRMGYGSTSLSELMAATGLEKGGIYRHFESKEALACEVFDYTASVIEEERFGGEARAAPGLPRLEHFITDFGSVRSSIGGGCAIFNAAVEHDDGNPALKKRARVAFGRFVGRIAQYIDEAKEEGHLKPSVKSESLAKFVLCSLEGALIAQRLTGDKSMLPEQAKTLVGHVHAYKNK
jgi:TetR/AcrR family transcriptional repressor of nem operon